MKSKKPRSLLGIEGMESKEINALLKLAARMEPTRRRNTLRGKTVVLLFYENSTRTRSSFELAAKVLGATTILITATASSIEKGESLIDTGYTVRALGADAIVMRHPSSGAHWLLAEHLDIPIINAGDGMHEHPSQGLLDALTILQAKKKFKGLKIAIVGDIYHSRVARSNVHLLPKLGAKVVLCGPPDLCPDEMAKIASGIEVSHNLDHALSGADVVMSLRVQKERLVGRQIGVEDYIANYQITPEKLALAKKDAVLMHPGPIIRGMELTSEVADGHASKILAQVHNGVKVRMAILQTLLAKN
ncbi:aspartate carbamoyltransferase [Candidatus Koribacter versatilis Ellin345]|uniref:Aspartate carbamoyltransferase catalytic subunit n=1 Tax=Koribacter versatilis (strain Ellin345) TaxID=204669 RepID=PYRB_KORVE|nr:aspartate carbamoyltransferase catalytic subunit [Candidatus Koribacter versatilis]Q1IHT1.1 RecName: Full=Aspartate carbamoyltransferase catalytic subunit; AltName: Full=Aspartate transcarbamylase; Short=ATCase [Candidatus Koribacter versatilis Ellin345]ABF43569.1 aspartate carbamoyltransferase [Candidatus Koribacter versatilis Ellin345]